LGNCATSGDALCVATVYRSLVQALPGGRFTILQHKLLNIAPMRYALGCALHGIYALLAGISELLALQRWRLRSWRVR